MKDRCIICNNETIFLMKKEEYTLFKCDFCGLVYMNPLPNQNFLNKEVYSFESGYQANKVNDLSKTIPSKKTEDILNYLQKENMNGKILDVGCSSGEFLYHAKKRGLETFGVELNRRTAEIAIRNGLNVFIGLLTDAHFKDNSFDIIFLGDVIEHVLAPVDFVNECRSLLKPGGMLIISTPNLDCAWSKMTFKLYKYFSIPWSSVTPPHHTFQFSENNLDMIMMSKGFSKLKSWFYKPPRLMYELGSLHLLKKYKNSRKMKDLFFMFFSFSLYTTTYFLVVCTRLFRKKDFSMIAIYKKYESML